uniref:Uncharacterized protein n=1 Tax=viral metagenome TaxID=1070528 RepID=A0A6C0EDI6_9ZZZZ
MQIIFESLMIIFVGDLNYLLFFYNHLILNRIKIV